MKKFIFLFVLSFSVLVLKCEDSKKKEKESDSSKVFVPTHEWQPIPKDTPIPRSLHVRLNLYTGEREAKLLDPEESNKDDRASGLIAVGEPIDGEPNEKLSWEELKDALHKMEDKTDIPEPNPDYLEKIRKKFRSYSELKKELGNAKLSTKTETEIIDQLIDEYKEAYTFRTSIVDKKELEFEESLLSHLEYLVHQIDNADHFMKFNGIKEIVFQSLNSTSWKVRYEATKLLGAAVQNNPKGKINAVDNGAVPVLLRSLSLDSNSQVKSGVIYAIGCLIRRFPFAQNEFIEKGGLPALIKQFDTDTIDQIKIQIKVLSLIRDLMTEATEANETLSSDAYNQAEALAKYNQYKSLRLNDKLAKEGWCNTLVKTLSRHASDVDLVQVIVLAMIPMVNQCSAVYDKHSHFLYQVADHYKNLIGYNEHDYLWIHSLFLRLSILRDKYKDEL